MGQKLSKWVRVATEGNTVDGRFIKPNWLTEAAESYDQNTYGARVWIEHLRSYRADGDFNAQGTVTGLRTQKEIVNGDEKLTLYAQIQANSTLVEMNDAGVKIYSSIEIDDNFAGTGKAYMTGLGITDSPVSIGTQPLQFSKQKTDQQFMSTAHSYLRFDVEKPSNEPETPTGGDAGVFAKAVADLKAFVSGLGKQANKGGQTDPALVEALTAFSTTLQEGMSEQVNQLNALAQKYTALEAELKTLKEQYKVLDETPAFTAERPVSTGGKPELLADC